MQQISDCLGVGSKPCLKSRRRNHLFDELRCGSLVFEQNLDQAAKPVGRNAPQRITGIANGLIAREHPFCPALADMLDHLQGVLAPGRAARPIVQPRPNERIQEVRAAVSLVIEGRTELQQVIDHRDRALEPGRAKHLAERLRVLRGLERLEYFQIAAGRRHLQCGLFPVGLVTLWSGHVRLRPGPKQQRDILRASLLNMMDERAIELALPVRETFVILLVDPEEGPDGRREPVV